MGERVLVGMGDSEAERWREKYLHLMEVEEERLVVLRRGLVCVSLAVDNVDSHLEKRLHELRELLRSNVDTKSLAPLVDQIEEAVRKLDQRRSHGKEQQRERFIALLEALQPLASSRKQRRQVKDFRSRLDSDETLETASLLTEYLSLLKSLLKDYLTDNESGGKGFLSRIWGGAKVAKAPLVQSEEVDDLSEEKPVSAAEALRPEQFEIGEASASPGAEREEVRERVGEILRGLLDRLGSVMESERREELQQRWQEGVEWNRLPELLDETVGFMMGVSAAKAREYEAFLLGLSRRLVEVHQFLQARRGQDEEVSVSSQQFNASMKQELDGLRHSVAEAGNIAEVKNVIEIRLDDIVALVDEYQEQELQRGQNLQAEVQELESRLRQMEKESQKLRESVRAERLRAQQDVLTGLPNRQAWIERSELEYQRWQRYRTPLSFLVVDVDLFKQVNDTYGHLAGDKVLRLVARSLQNAMRQTDFIARFGGEEFVALLPQTAMAAAMVAAEKLRSAVETCPFHFAGTPVVVTISLGVAEFASGDTIEQVLDRADQRLLRAKEAGRNRVVGE